jgi:hypothetical protein
MMRDVDCFFAHSAIEIVRFYVHRNIISSLLSYSRVISFYGDFWISRFNCSIDGYVKLNSNFSVGNNKEFEAKKTQSINQIIPATQTSFFFPFIKWITRHSSALDVS